VYRRLSLRLLCLVLITFFTLPALAQFTRDNAASKKIDEAINEHYLATNFDKAESVLTGTINACGDKCSPGVIARAWMYVGIVRGSGKNDQAGAKDAFQRALGADPGVKLDTQIATPETQRTFADLSALASKTPAEMGNPKTAAPAANESAGDRGGLKCTPEVSEVQTRRPIPIECTSDEEVASMELRYKPFGADTWKSVKMKKKDDAFRAEVPCDASGSAGTLRLYVRAQDAAGEAVDSYGSKAKPIEVQVSENSAAEPPAYAGEPAPARCVAQEECPPDFPGCQDKPKRGTKDWGQACDNSMNCKEGLLCNDGTCEAAPACETSADCQTGTCVDNKCSVGEGGDAAAGPKYKKNWLGLHFAQDIAWVSGTDVCSAASRANNGFACYAAGTTDQPYIGDPYPGANISGGTVVATHRILVSFDRALSPNITLGVRAGFVFGGGPPAGRERTSTTDPPPNTSFLPANVGSAGTAFLPAHVEARLSYWFGKSPLAKKGVRPYVHLGGGIAQVDAKVKVPVSDCTSGNLPPDDNSKSAPRYLCSLGQQGNYDPTNTMQVPRVELDAWKKLGQSFITAGGGVVYAFKENLGAQLNLNLMFMLPSSGLVIEPSLGVVYGF
jgi:hypothetical protein